MAIGATILIKRTAGVSSLPTLRYGEIAVSISTGTYSNQGGRLWIGDEVGNPIAVGGRYYTDLLTEEKLATVRNSDGSPAEVDENGNITSEDAHSVEAIPERDSVIINGVTYHEGSLIQADIRKGGHWTTVVGRLNFINLTPASNEYVICQDIYPGSEKFTTPAIIDAKPRYGFKHSWSFHVKNGKITTADTRNIKLIYTTDYLAFVSGSPKDESYKLDINPDIDDDPMPEGWTPSEKDLIFLK